MHAAAGMQLLRRHLLRRVLGCAAGPKYWKCKNPFWALSWLSSSSACLQLVVGTACKA